MRILLFKSETIFQNILILVILVHLSGCQKALNSAEKDSSLKGGCLSISKEKTSDHAERFKLANIHLQLLKNRYSVLLDRLTGNLVTKIQDSKCICEFMSGTITQPCKQKIEVGVNQGHLAVATCTDKRNIIEIIGAKPKETEIANLWMGPDPEGRQVIKYNIMGEDTPKTYQFVLPTMKHDDQNLPVISSKQKKEFRLIESALVNFNNQFRDATWRPKPDEEFVLNFSKTVQALQSFLKWQELYSENRLYWPASTPQASDFWSDMTTTRKSKLQHLMQHYQSVYQFLIDDMSVETLTTEPIDSDNAGGTVLLEKDSDPNSLRISLTELTPNKKQISKSEYYLNKNDDRRISVKYTVDKNQSVLDLILPPLPESVTPAKLETPRNDSKIKESLASIDQLIVFTDKTTDYAFGGGGAVLNLGLRSLLEARKDFLMVYQSN